MKVGYAVLYEDGELTISKEHTLLQKKIEKDYGEFIDTDVPWKNESSKIKKVQILDYVKSNCMREWFINCQNLTTLIDFRNLDVSDCVDFSFMFDYCINLTDINSLSDWDVSNGKNFEYMFCDCENLINISSLENWDVSNGENFEFMFSYCEKLKNIYLPNILNQLNKNMFYQCNPNLKIHWKEHIYTYEDLIEYGFF